MPRNAEVIRQWHVLRSIESARLGCTIDELAADANVSTRTIRRDLAALMEAGFPIYDDRVDGRSRWKLEGQPFRSLDEAGFTLSEACALYVGRTLLQSMMGHPLDAALNSAFQKFERALAPLGRFLDALPQVLTTKTSHATRDRPPSTHLARLLEAIVHHRQVAMQYHSMSSGGDKAYTVDPHRLVHGDGGLYLLAYVPSYGAARTFAVERIRTLSLLETGFERRDAETTTALEHSIGVYEGTPVRVRLRVDARLAPYVAERRWHATQRVHLQGDGSAIIELDVSLDWPLRRWILGFGSAMVVLAPDALASEIAAELRSAAAIYDAGRHEPVPPADRHVETTAP